MTQVKWLIEDFASDNSFGLLAKEAKDLGMEAKIVSYKPFGAGRTDYYPDEDCVLFQGSIGFAKQIQRERKWIPGVWCKWENYKCSTYYAHWGKYLLNNDYALLPLAEVFRRREEFLEKYNGSFFIRPDTGDKSFSGTLIHKEDFEKNKWKYIQTETYPTDLVLLASPKNVDKEWRVFCSNKQVITGCLYHQEGKFKPKAELPEEIEKLALEICSTNFQPDPIYALDFTIYKDEPRLLEIGAFSVAGLYKSDLKKLIEAASTLATEEWKSFQ